MALASVVLLLLYSALMFATLYVKIDKIKFIKLIAIAGIAAAIVHTVLYFVAYSHWAILLTSLVLFMAYANLNGIFTKKPHILHWIVRFVISVAILILFII